MIGIPEYLRKQGQKDFQKIIARFRCENEELRNKFWREQEKEVETLEHLATSCTEDTRNNKRISQILREKEEGISWMKIILRLRK